MLGGGARDLPISCHIWANWRHEGPPVYAMPQNLLKGAGHCGFSPSTFARNL